MPRCPVCGEELIEVGYPKDFFQEYRCPNGCNFKPPLSWRLWDALGVAVVMILFICFLLFVVFGYFSEKFARRV